MMLNGDKGQYFLWDDGQEDFSIFLENHVAAAKDWERSAGMDLGAKHVRNLLRHVESLQAKTQEAESLCKYYQNQAKRHETAEIHVAKLANKYLNEWNAARKRVTLVTMLLPFSFGLGFAVALIFGN